MNENASELLPFESADEENKRLREENARLRRALTVHGITIPSQSPTNPLPAKAVEAMPLESKEDRARKRIELFRGLFRGREDVYARRWESADGRSGYVPAALKDWRAINKSRPEERKKVDQKTRKFVPVTDAVIESHLLGKETIGVYPLLLDETCWFLAADFDKKTWEYDSLAFLETCREMGVPAALERSRSGKGGHIWIFFDRALPAITARKLGCVVLTRTMERRHQLGLDSYDRFFPNQDTMPKGGLGNLIALPLQFAQRKSGNSVFIDSDFRPYSDQWHFLSTIRRMAADAADEIVAEAQRKGDLIGVRISIADDEGVQDPWTLPPSRKRKERPIEGPLTIPRLDGVAVAHQLREGKQATAGLVRTFVQAGLAEIDDWIPAKRNPFEFLKRSLDRWLEDHRVSRIQEQFFLDLTISTSLDRYFGPNDCSPADTSDVFLTLEPESAGYIIMGPTLRLLEAAHARLPATFVHLFLGALNKWVRVYDYRDALDRVERLREWYESDPEGGEVELPDILRCIPGSLKRRPLSAKSVAKIVPCIENQLARQLMELAVELNRSSSQVVRPQTGEDVRELLMDCGEPVPALLAVFERNDSIEGCFDEECQGMLELTPEPNLIVPFNGDSRESVVAAFAVLATVANTLSCASQLMRIMPGNERVN